MKLIWFYCVVCYFGDFVPVKLGTMVEQLCGAAVKPCFHVVEINISARDIWFY
jgi:hypothetical protein